MASSGQRKMLALVNINTLGVLLLRYRVTLCGHYIVVMFCYHVLLLLLVFRINETTFCEAKHETKRKCVQNWQINPPPR